MRLTDEQLAHVASRIVEDQPKCHLCGGAGFVDTRRGGRPCSICDGTGFFALGTETMRSIVAELRELRELLATPLPDAMSMQLVATLDGRAYVSPGPYTPDEAKALGAALIRAALQAKGGK